MNETMSNQTNFYDNPSPVHEPAAAESKSADNDDEWKDFDFNAVDLRKPRVTRVLPRHEMLKVVIAGLLSGALIWLLRLALENWLLRPLFCRTPDTATLCASADTTSFVVALVIVGAITVSILTHQRVFRAVLISVAAFVGLGALWPILDLRNAVWATILAALFTAGLYLFFSLVGSIKKYVSAVLAMAILVVGFWLLVRM